MMTTIALIYVMCLIGMCCKCTNTAVPSLASISAETQKVALRTKQRVRRNIMQISDYGGHGSAPNGSYGGPGAHYHSGSQGNYSGPDQGCPYCNPNGYSQGPAPRPGQPGYAGPYFDNLNARKNPRRARSKAGNFVDFCQFFTDSYSPIGGVLQFIAFVGVIIGVIALFIFLVFFT